WIGAVALALGRIGYADRPLYDYVQHGRNVIGHCAPPATAWWRRAWATVCPPTALAVYGRHYHMRFLLAREFARLLLVRCGPDLAPGRIKPLRRLAAADRSVRAWAWLAGRGLWHRRVTLGGEYALLTSVLWRACSGLRA